MADMWQKLPKSKGIEFYITADGTKSFKLRAMVNGQKYTDVLGSRSEEEAREIKALLDRNRKIGKGPQTYLEMVSADKAAKKAEAEARKRDALNTISVLSEDFLVFREAQSKAKKRSTKDLVSIRGRHRNWIQKFLGKIPVSTMTQEDIESMVEAMQDAARSTRTIQAVLGELAQLWDYAVKKRIVLNNSIYPGKHIELSSLNNKRAAFLTWDQAQALLKYFWDNGKTDIHDLCLVTMYTGMRPSESFRLTWDQTKNGLIFKTKNGKQRHIAFTHPAVQEMLSRRKTAANSGGAHDLVFPRTKPDAHGNMVDPRTTISKTFNAAVKKLGFYTPIPAPMDKNGNLLSETPRAKADREQQNRNNKVVFYSLRHTFASWLVQSGIPLYVVRDAMGHTSQEMTERYAHLAPSHIQNAVMALPGGTIDKTGTVDAEYSVIDS